MIGKLAVYPMSYGDTENVQIRIQDERHAWDTYCAFSPYSDPKLQAGHADKLLEERRKRWGGV
jgi:hypothetical protein